MSAKQLKKLRDLREAQARASAEASPGGGGDSTGSSEEEVEDIGGEQAPAAGFARLAALAGDTSSSSEEEEKQNCNEESQSRGGHGRGDAEATATTSCSTALSSGARRRRRKGVATSCAAAATELQEPSRGQREGDGGVVDDDDDALLDAAVAVAAEEDAEDSQAAGGLAADAFHRGVLAMRRGDFSVENERKRATGGLGGLFASGGTGGGALAGGGGGAARQQRRKAVQARTGGEGRTAHHRRLYLVTPTEEECWWPRPGDGPVMSASSDDVGSVIFDVEETTDSTRCLVRLRACLRAQDPALLQEFLRSTSPFSVDGLLIMAEHHRTNQAPEQAFQLVRRAVYAVECCFGAGFSPFQASNGAGPAGQRPAVTLRLQEDLDWPGWTMLRALWMYMQCLAAAGMFRTALEVCKLILATTLPRDPTHALLAFDFLCLRARQHDYLVKFSTGLVADYALQSSESDISDADSCGGTRCVVALPNIAFSAALAGLLKVGSLELGPRLNEIHVADVLAGIAGSAAGDGDQATETGASGSGLSGSRGVEPQDDSDGGTRALACLMRALLLFPLAVRPLLEEAGVQLQGHAPGGSSSRESWAELLARPPFSDAATFRHDRHGLTHARICAFYARRCGALWKADLPMRCLHSCAARLVGMYGSPLFAAELTAARTTWASGPLSLGLALAQDLSDVLPDEGAEVPSMPTLLTKAAEERLKPSPEELAAAARGGDDEDEDDAGGLFGRRRVDRGAEGRPNISLHTPALLIFWQSLLPWAELDRTGLVVEPITFSGIGRSAFASVAGVWRIAVAVLLEVWETLKRKF